MNEIEFNALIEKGQKELKQVLCEREKEYGNFYDISEFVNTFFTSNMTYTTSMLANIDIKDFKAMKVAVFMLGLKLARLEKDNKNPHFDSIVDFLGYLHLLKSTNIKGLKLYCVVGSSKLHKQLIDFANKELENDC